jgi:hypothetical protein
MAPYKLEDNIREKLETRELKPSADAWKKLEAKLDAEQPKKKSNVLYYVAASFVGILILASVFFSRNNSEVNNQIVEEKIQQSQTNSQPEIIPNKTLSEEVVSEERNSEEKQKPNTREVKVIPPKKSTIDKKMENTEALANVSNEEIKKPVFKEDLIISEEDKLINDKVDEVVASVKKLQEDNAEISTTEVERLLHNARSDIQTQRILNSPKVDATALLKDVEWELDKSFRDKVFDALGEGFQKVRTAVSERND